MGTKFGAQYGDTKVVSAKERGEGIGFQRVRRITGYLSEVSAFNNGKRAELHDRVKHDCSCSAFVAA